MKFLSTILWIGLPVFILMTLGRCTKTELNQWKELGEEVGTDSNKVLLDKARKGKKKALNKLEEL